MRLTVKELIEILQAYPSDMPVAIVYELEWDKSDIRIIEEFYNGDPANPNCEVINNVLNIGW